ncbi:hypothetical protein HMN09_00128800 [Mycena chlorophos]|uniref:F-box domain-containing protein n=1 Tax=Mycena chlorophos TaxID=658473 RepID=A0A8H6WQL2_MYCCL|nr:hypothetical protein HMN09_00128800 [Mycena chlorophos]
MYFCDLPEDLLIGVAYCCDVASVLNLGQTCKHLYAISRTKSVWISIINDLKVRGFVDERAAPDASNLPFEGLVEVIRRILDGPRSWRLAEGGNTFEPKVKHHIEVQYRATAGPFLPNLKLVPGGQYFMMRDVDDPRGLECWDIYLQCRVWRLPWPEILQPEHVVSEYAVVRKESGVLLLAVLFNKEHTDDPRLEVSEVDLRPAVPVYTLHCSAKIPAWRILSFVADSDLIVLAPLIEGDTILFNWRTNSVGMLANQTREVMAIAAAPGFIALLLSPDNSGAVVQIIDAQSINEHLHYVDETSHPQPDPRVPIILFNPVFAHQLPAFNPYEAPHGIVVFSSPLADNMYRIWAATDSGQDEHGREDAGSLHRLEVVYNARSTEPPLLRSIVSPQEPGGQPDMPSLAFSGHWASISTVWLQVVHPEGWHEIIKDMDNLLLAPYAGACITIRLGEGKVQVLYFE